MFPIITVENKSQLEKTHFWTRHWWCPQNAKDRIDEVLRSDQGMIPSVTPLRIIVVFPSDESTIHLGWHRQCGFSWLALSLWKIRLPLMLEEARDSLSFLAWRPMLNFPVNCILNEQFSSASLNGIIWIARLSTSFMRITIYVCQHVFLVVSTHCGVGHQGWVFSHS